MTLDPKKRPNPEEVDRFFRHHENLWAGAIEEWTKADRFFSGTYDLWPGLPEEAKKARPSYHSSRGRNIVDHAVDALAVFAPHIHRPRSENNDRAKASADRLERALAEILMDAFLQETMMTSKTAGRYMVMYNYAQLYTGMDLNRPLEKPTRMTGEDKEDFDIRMDEWEFQRMGWNPIRMRAPHPGEVFMDPYDKNPHIAVRRFKLEAYRLHALTLKKKQQRRKDVTIYDLDPKHDPYDEIEVVEVWTPWWHGLKHPGNEYNFFTERNTWGFQPYSHAFGSGGNVPTIASTNFDPRYLAQGFLHPVMESIRYRDQRLTAQQLILMRAAMAKRGTRLDPTEAVEQMQGDVLFGEEADWWTEKLPQLPNNIFAHGEEVDKDIDEGSFNLQVAGFRQSGVDTATQQVILSEASNRKFAVIQAQLGSLFSIGASNVLRLATQLNEQYGIDTINVGENALRASDIRDNFRVFVTFENVDPVVYQQQVAQSATLVAQGLESKEGHWRTARVEDVTSKRMEILLDQARELPGAKMQSLALAMRILGMEGFADKLEQQAKMLVAQENGGEFGDQAVQTGSGAPPNVRGGEVPGGPPLLVQ